MWNIIVNPKNGNKVNVNSNIGKGILRNYIKQLGGVKFRNKEEEERFNEFKKKMKNDQKQKQQSRLKKKGTSKKIAVVKSDLADASRPPPLDSSVQMKWQHSAQEELEKNIKLSLDLSKKQLVHIEGDMESSNIKGLNWIKNSCYIDSVLLCLFTQESIFTESLLNKNIEEFHYDLLDCGQNREEDIQNKRFIQTELRSIQNFILGNTEEDIKYCSDLRDLFKKCHSLIQFSTKQPNDSALFLQNILNILLPDETSHVNHTESIYDTNDNLVDFNVYTNCNDSIIYNIPVNIVKDISPKNPKNIKDFLVQQIDNVLERNDQIFRKIENIELIYTPYLIFNVTRTDYDHKNNRIKNIYKPIGLDMMIQLPNGQEFILTGVVIWHSGHYVCIFKFKEYWYFYNDNTKHKIIKYGTFDNLIQSIHKNYNPFKKGTMYFYTPTNVIPKPECN